MLYKFELDPNTAEATKNIYCMKDESWLQYNKQMAQEILLKLQKLSNPASCTWRVSGEPGISKHS